MKSKYKISIIIPNYNGAHLLEKNLPRVMEAAGDKVIEIIVVDDGSEDNSKLKVQTAKQKYKSIKLTEHKKNLGFASAVNTGVKHAKGDIVVLLNTDVLPEKGFLEPLLSHFADPKVFAVGCMDKSVENGEVVKRGRGVAWWERGFLMHKRGEVDKKDTFWVNGGSGAFRKSIWNKLGGMDELYNPFYWEDIDLSYRAVKSGYKIIFETKSVVVHEHAKGAIKSRFSSFETRTIAYRNQFYFVWKNITDRKLIVSHILWIPHYFIKFLLRLDFAFFVGLFLATGNLDSVINKRRSVKSLFKLNDFEIIK